MQSTNKNNSQKQIKHKTKMELWGKFLRSLETEGGSIMILILLIMIFAFFRFLGFKDAESQIIFILGALVGLLKGRVDKEKEKDKE